MTECKAFTSNSIIDKLAQLPLNCIPKTVNNGKRYFVCIQSSEEKELTQSQYNDIKSDPLNLVKLTQDVAHNNYAYVELYLQNVDDNKTKQNLINDLKIANNRHYVMVSTKEADNIFRLPNNIDKEITLNTSDTQTLFNCEYASLPNEIALETVYMSKLLSNNKDMYKNILKCVLATGNFSTITRDDLLKKIKNMDKHKSLSDALENRHTEVVNIDIISNVMPLNKIMDIVEKAYIINVKLTNFYH